MRYNEVGVLFSTGFVRFPQVLSEPNVSAVRMKELLDRRCVLNLALTDV